MLSNSAFPSISSAEIRLLSDPAERAQALATFRAAMVGLPPFGPPSDKIAGNLVEPERAFGAFHDGKLVGTTNSFSGKILVPDGKWLPHAAVTHVGVLPTHTRQGIASALMQRQLRAARERGEIIATLRASDARIYRRFGYGIASTCVSFDLNKSQARLAAPAVTAPVRLLQIGEAWPVMARIYAAQPLPRPGTITRASFWWDFQKLRHEKGGASAYVAVVGEEGAETGYVRYHPVGSDTWFTSTQRVVVVDDLVPHDAEAYRALIAHLLSLDLPHRFLFPQRAADDALPWLFEDFRAATVTGTRDETWLRLIDAQAALASRTYRGNEEAILEITDALLPQNNVRLCLSASGAEPTSQPAGIVADVSAVSAAYLGGTRWWQLAQAGRLQVRSPESVAALDELFAAPAAPFAGTMF